MITLFEMYEGHTFKMKVFLVILSVAIYLVHSQEVYTGSQILVMDGGVRYYHNTTNPINVCGEEGVPMLKVYYSVIQEASAFTCSETNDCVSYNITSSFKITLEKRVTDYCACMSRPLTNPYYLPPINCTDPRAECGNVVSALNYCPVGEDLCFQICTASITQVYISYGNIKPNSIIIPANVRLDYYSFCYMHWLGWNWPAWSCYHYGHCP